MHYLVVPLLLWIVMVDRGHRGLLCVAAMVSRETRRHLRKDLTAAESGTCRA